jgi:hypothetical protein
VLQFFLVLHALRLLLAFATVPAREENLRLLFFKDSSRDFLSKQELVRFLGGLGCSFSDIKSVDSRVREALIALSRSDWPVAAHPCPWKEIRLARKAESTQSGFEVADFVLEGSTWTKQAIPAP